MALQDTCGMGQGHGAWKRSWGDADLRAILLFKFIFLFNMAVVFTVTV